MDLCSPIGIGLDVGLHCVCRILYTLIEECDNVLTHANHIRRHADTNYPCELLMYRACFAPHADFLSCDIRLSRKKNRIVY